jgi:hypothetical protein
VIADSHHFDEEKDPYPDQHQKENSDSDLHHSEKAVPDPDPHQSEKRDQEPNSHSSSTPPMLERAEILYKIQKYKYGVPVPYQLPFH